MLKVGYALIAVFLLVFIPACSTVEVEEVVAAEQGELTLAPPAEPARKMMTLAAFCRDTPGNRAEMRKIISTMDHPAYGRLMRSKTSTCADSTILKRAPLVARFTEPLDPPFRTPGGECMQFVGFIDAANQRGFSWTPVDKTKCGQDA